MDKTNDDLWLAFEALAKTYPHDNGVRMTADLTRWLLEERQRLKLAMPPIIEEVVHTLTNASDATAALPSRETPITSGSPLTIRHLTT